MLGNQITFLVDRHQHVGPIILRLVFEDRFLHSIDKTFRVNIRIGIPEFIGAVLGKGSWGHGVVVTSDDLHASLPEAPYSDQGLPAAREGDDCTSYRLFIH